MRLASYLILSYLILTTALHGREAPPVPELPRLPALSPTEALNAFQLSPGFTISAAATEPIVVDPVAMSFDDKGALFVAEMRDYSERQHDRLSRIRKLVDRDGDGVFEVSTVFKQGLAWVTSVCWHKDRIYVTASPDIWCLQDTDDDGVADVTERIFT